MRTKEVLDRVGFALLLGVASLGVNEIRSMGDSIADLNIKMAVVLERLTVQDRRDSDHEKRLESLESKGH